MTKLNISRPHYKTLETLEHFNDLNTPVWVFDVDNYCMWWGSKSALVFWKARSVTDLQQRDFSTDSEVVRLRLRQIVDSPVTSGSIQDVWTIYPNEKPTTINLDMKPVFIENGRNAIIFEASPILNLGNNPESLRLLEAARSSTILVSTYNASGELLSANPTAHECYAGLQPSPPLSDFELRFMDKSIVPLIRESIKNSGVYKAELKVNTALGERVHHITASQGRDPVTGEFITVLSEEDRTEKAKLRQDLQTLNEHLEQRVAERTKELEQANNKLLIEITERQHIEEELRRAQRMEAVGNLTGGIAHDFNNILAIILSNLDFLDLDNSKIDAAHHSIRKAATRGAELTQRLLAFSRKQSLEPQPIDLPTLIETTIDLLNRTFDATIRITIHAPDDQWLAFADPGQLENSILNIALNSRDAMLGGGHLEITTANLQIDATKADHFEDLKQGEYVVLTISDNGTGMPEEVKSHAFEPFYTTKEVGKGSGLGLSMVYGFAKQSGGTTSIESQSGKGTTLTLILPRSQQQVTHVALPPDNKPVSSDGETVLVIEDNLALLDVIQNMLKTLGYCVLTATDAQTATHQLAAHEQIDIILSDVVLPNGISGPEFIALARQSTPNLKVVFMSGYPRDSLIDSEFYNSDDRLLQKPYTKSELSKVLRSALNADCA